MNNELKLNNETYNNLIFLLNKSNKSSKELKFIYNKLKFSSWFNNVLVNKEEWDWSNFKMYELCKNMKYLYIPENTVLIKENDLNNLNIYFILKGKVAIYKKSINNYNLDNKDNNANTNHKKLSKLYRKNSGLRSNRNLENLGNFVRILGENSLVGENSNINFIKRRTASAISITKVEWIYISKKIFDHKLKKILKVNTFDKENFINSIFNENWKKDIIDKIFFSTKLKEYPRNSIIVKQGDLPKKIYFIYKGKIKIFKKNVIKKNKINEINKKFFNPIIDLENLDFSNYFGEEILFEPLKKINYNAIVESSYSLIYILDIKNIEYIPNLINLIKESFKNYYFRRKNNRWNKIKNLLNILNNKKEIQNEKQKILKIKLNNNLKSFNTKKLNSFNNKNKNGSLFQILQDRKNKKRNISLQKLNYLNKNNKKINKIIMNIKDKKKFFYFNLKKNKPLMKIINYKSDHN